MSTRTGSLTRAIAIDALTHVLTRRIHADTALDKLFAHNHGLRQLDRAFIFEMVYGTLRWLSKMDWIMSHMMDRSFSSLDPRVANALRIGAYQIYYMNRVPARAAVSETVEAIKQVGAQNAASFVNAILRRVANKAEYFVKPDKEKDPVEYYAMHYSHPKWMVERWLKVLSSERLEHLCMGNNIAPKQALRILHRNAVPGGGDIATYLLREHGISSNWRPLKNCLGIENLPPFAKCEAFAAGCYAVQDEASQLVASIIMAAKDDTIFDACAAPGMKAIVTWDEGATPQNMLICDFSPKRLEVLKSNFTRVKLDGCEIVKGDAVVVAQNRKFSKIILDAPCSSMGVIRRHPEIKWLRSIRDIERNAMEQERLLAGLANNVAPNGEMIYMVCSTEAEETTLQIEKFLGKNPKFSIGNMGARVHDYYKKYLTKRNEILVYPGNTDDIDGFYAVILTKNK